jgi:hypothetical protein
VIVIASVPPTSAEAPLVNVDPDCTIVSNVIVAFSVVEVYTDELEVIPPVILNSPDFVPSALCEMVLLPVNTVVHPACAVIVRYPDQVPIVLPAKYTRNEEVPSIRPPDAVFRTWNVYDNVLLFSPDTGVAVQVTLAPI